MRPVQISIAPIMTTVGEIVVVTAQAWPITRFPMMTKITPMMFGAATQTIRSSLLMICSPPFVQPTMRVRLSAKRDSLNPLVRISFVLSTDNQFAHCYSTDGHESSIEEGHYPDVQARDVNDNAEEPKGELVEKGVDDKPC